MYLLSMYVVYTVPLIIHDYICTCIAVRAVARVFDWSDQNCQRGGQSQLQISALSEGLWQSPLEAIHVKVQ